MYTAGTDANIYFSSNDGASFTPLFTSSTSSSSLYEIDVFQNGEALLCGSQGTILKSTDFLSSKDISSIENNFTHFYDSSNQILNIVSNDEMNQVQFISMDGKIISTFKTVLSYIIIIEYFFVSRFIGYRALRFSLQKAN